MSHDSRIITTDTGMPVTDYGAGRGSLSSYVAGFVLSLLLTLIAFGFVYTHVNSGHTVFSHELLIPLVIGLAIAQLFTQLVFFLHLGRGSNRRWNVVVLLFATLVVLILVVGSLWIMANLNYRMTPQQINSYIQNQGGF